MRSKKLSLRITFLVWIIAVVAGGFAVTGALLITRAAALQRDTALMYAEQLAARNSAEVAESIGVALNAATVLAHSLGAMQVSGFAQRDAVNAMLKRVLEGNQAFVGSWSGWEPQAFDGKDAEHVSQPGHDATGRFVPYWFRRKAEVVLEPLVDYDKSGAGDYYLLPKNSKQSQLIEPYVYPVGGVDMLITSLSVPILDGGNFKGVAGIDIALDELQRTVSQVRIYETGYGTLVSNTGIVVGDKDAQNVG